jgi:hypothetical protein
MNPASYSIFKLISVTNLGSISTLTVEFISPPSGILSPASLYVLSFHRTGDFGATGPSGPAGPAGAPGITVFDGGSPSFNYANGPVFDLGRPT